VTGLRHLKRTRRELFSNAAKFLAAALPLNALPAYRGNAPLSAVDRFNYVLGTQTIGATYQFTQASVLGETAGAILDLGSNLAKFTMGRGYERMMHRATRSAYQETVQYLLNQGADALQEPRWRMPGANHSHPTGNPNWKNLTELAQHEPSYRWVLDAPFAYYHLWAYSLTSKWWREGFPEESQEAEYREIHDFAAYLLKTYSGSGKSFYLGHWEGDWHLKPWFLPWFRPQHPGAEVTPANIKGMVNWLTARQRAVDDAKRDTPHHDVNVFHYSEANLVHQAIDGRPSVAGSVLPQVDVDYISYSTYDSLGDVPAKLPKALDYLATVLRPKPGVPGNRVFIGEYGFSRRSFSEAERDRKSREIMSIGLEYGCPFILAWQMYNNEYSDGAENGYWLIDDKGVKQLLWHTHHNFYKRARRHVATVLRETGKVPSPDEFARFAKETLRSL